MSYSQKKPRKPIYDPESGEPPTERQVEKMKKQADNVASYWLDQKGMTVFEMREKLLKKGLINEIVEWKISQLSDQLLLNDRMIAENFVHFRKDQMSERKLREKLKSRGVDAELIDEVVNDLTHDDQISGASVQAVRRARTTRHEQNPHKRRQKILTSVMSKGYSMDIASVATDNALLVVPAEEVALSESDEMSNEDQWESDVKLAESKARATRSKTNPLKRKQSMIMSMMRKGIGFDRAKEAVDHVLSEEN